MSVEWTATLQVLRSEYDSAALLRHVAVLHRLSRSRDVLPAQRMG